ncbi:winged helix-turn-helix domain-containing protein [Microvirga sp. 3-52]|uniref:ATP-binding protein n=1 Tax=Microvirga sp. 3-52 TaxID=2792425 RepID=UPI001AC15F35|nr:winged helix-turn-helix domain-containing protein [Microvirga sp. 3-52]MBO1908489.1 winged helix-turn-helix domain-containing protein [Microvirga sp. 3-52]MBS7455021.1 winged helix-turn-helix domain-containing protein [Microvirga sp. 3-52]
MKNADVRFGPFTLISSERVLLREGEPIRIGSRALDILIALVSRAGEVVTKEELISAVWPRTFVEETNLRVNVAALRKALGDLQEPYRFISNVTGRGYCFVASVSEAKEPARHIQAETSKPRQTLPATGSLPRQGGRVIGRDGELDLLDRQLHDLRILTIVGTGGIGKTTVAVCLAQRNFGRFLEGIAFVDLGPLADPALLPTAVAKGAGCVLGTADHLTELAGQLGERSMLLILDCCEHLVDDVARLVETLAASAPGVRFLVTSREPLRVQGERVHRLAPLTFPSEVEADNAASALEFAAVQLFVERVADSIGGYDLGDAEAPLVAEICRRLDGIGLAIELAAAQVDSLGIEGLAVSLRNSFDGLTRGRRTALPRHQTLHAALDWSHSLLDEPQRFVLSHLSLFNKEFTMEAAWAVASDGGTIDLTACLGDLVAKSLVVADRSIHPARYRLLDMTRSYAAEKLSASGRSEEASRRHAAHYLALFGQAADQWQASHDTDWLSLHNRDMGNLRAALDWAFSSQGDRMIGVGLTIAAIPLWYQLSLVDECLMRVRQALEWLERQDKPDDRSLMQLYAALGFPYMRAISGRPSGAKAWERSLGIARRIDDVDFQLRALWALWVDRTNSGNSRAALEMAEEFHRMAARSRDPADRLIGERMRARSLHFLGDQPRAEAHVRRMLDEYRAPANGAHLARFQYEQRLTARVTLARVLWLRGRAQEALGEVEDMIETALQVDHNLTTCHVLSDAVCPVYLMAGDLDRAQHYTGMLLERTKAHALDVWHAYAECFQGDILIRQGKATAGVPLVRNAQDRLERAGFHLYRTVFHAVLASGLQALGRVDEALGLLDRALALTRQTGEAWYVPELLHQHARLLMTRSDAQEDARRLIAQSLALATEQGAVAWTSRVSSWHPEEAR